MVAKNLGCRTKFDDNVNANRVDVLIPEVIQVLYTLPYKTICVASKSVFELELRKVMLNPWFWDLRLLAASVIVQILRKENVDVARTII